MADNKMPPVKPDPKVETPQDSDPVGGWISYPEKVRVTQEIPQADGSKTSVEVDDVRWHRVPVKDWPAYEKAHGF